MEYGLKLKELTVEHQYTPLGIDCDRPRFAWKLDSLNENVFQTAFRICVFDREEIVADTGRIERGESIENVIPGWKAKPMTRYNIQVEAWDN